MFAAVGADTLISRSIEIARERADRFAADVAGLRDTLAGLRSRVRGRQPFLDLALGMDAHVRRHLVPLAAALYLVVTVTWTLVQRIVLRRRFPLHGG